MAKIGSMELIVILIVAMLAIGPERMPKAALGKAVGSFKKYMNDATSDLREASDEFREVTDEIADAQKFDARHTKSRLHSLIPFS